MYYLWLSRRWNKKNWHTKLGSLQGSILKIF